MSPRSVLITGCNRGIGLELVRQWLKVENPPQHIIATCRKPEEAKELSDIASGSSSVTIIPLDVKNYAQVRQAGFEYLVFPSYSNRLSIVSGHCRARRRYSGQGARAEFADQQCRDIAERRAADGPRRGVHDWGIRGQLCCPCFVDQVRLENLSKAAMFKPTTAYNFRALLPLLLTAAGKSSGDELSIERAAVIQVITASLWVLDYEATFVLQISRWAPTWPASRTTPAAVTTLIVAAKQLWIRLRGAWPWIIRNRASSSSQCTQVALIMSELTWLSQRKLSSFLHKSLKNLITFLLFLCTGWVRTDMGGANGMIDTEECCSTMVKTLSQLGRQDHGEFRRYNNTSLTWWMSNAFIKF